MIRILLIRHGSTDTVGRLIYGRMPGIHLNEEGRRQAEAVGQVIRKRYQLNQIISSPMERAQETASFIACPQNLSFSINEAFNELDVGQWTGKTIEDLRSSPSWKQYNRLRSLYAPPGGEKLIDVQQRSWNALDRIIREQKEGAVAIVTHGDVIRSLLLLFLGAPLDHILRLEVGTGSLSEVDLNDGQPLVRTINEQFW
jgi:broad specificity phosphatase PhoE